MQNTPQETIMAFFEAYSRRNTGDMCNRYSSLIYYSDPVFGLLKDEQVIKMWQFRVANSNELSLIYGNISDRGDNYYTCEWTATYRFAPTGKKIIHKAKAYMKVEDGIITEHSDAYSFYKWIRQAYGISGWILGWSSVYKKRVRKKLLEQLQING